VKTPRTIAAILVGALAWLAAPAPAIAQFARADGAIVFPGADGVIAYSHPTTEPTAHTVLAWTSPPDPCQCGVGGTAVDLGDRSVWDPAWSSSGSDLAFAAETSVGGNRAIYVQFDHSVIERVSRGPRDSIAPAWSPDGTRLAFTRIRDNGRPRVLVVDLETRAVSVVSGDLAAAADPTWSPDGSTISFSAKRSIGAQNVCGATCRWQLFTVDAEGGEPVALTDSSAGLKQPDWSPDGSRLAATVVDHGSIQGIGVVDAVTGEVVEFYSTGSSDTWYADPSWAPATTSSGPYRLAVTYGSTSGSDVIAVLHSEDGSLEFAAYGSQASWQPVPA
jgi:dipeptidyl aminopeptidase/acylaminoacyl peptidase